MAEVSDVLAGQWERQPDSTGCTYRSDRGAGFGTQVVGPASKAGLDAARRQCVAGPEPMTTAGDGFVCVERRRTGDLVVGNTVAHGQTWVVVIVPRSSGVHKAERAAMRVLMNAVPVEK